jgi:hemerythrin
LRRSEIVPILEWEKRFELEAEPFDGHHKHLVKLLNTVYDSSCDGASGETFGVVLIELIDYANYHFGAEESSMRFNEYPELELHREEHKTFCSMVVAFRDDIHAGRNDSAIDLISFLGNWLFDHILKTDALYCQFARQHNKPVAASR